MSYILDALKRADAQRGPLLPQANAPAAQPLFAQPMVSTKQWAIPWLLGLLAVVLTAFLLTLWWRSTARKPGPVETTTTHTEVAPTLTTLSVLTVPPAVVSPPAPTVAHSTPTSSPVPAAVAPQVTPTPAPARPTTKVNPPAQEMTAEVLSSLPKLSITGSTYSDNVALRMVIVNGVVLHEGDEVSPGVTLERIGEKTLTLVMQGRRFSLRL